MSEGIDSNGSWRNKCKFCKEHSQIKLCSKPGCGQLVPNRNVKCLACKTRYVKPTKTEVDVDVPDQEMEGENSEEIL